MVMKGSMQMTTAEEFRPWLDELSADDKEFVRDIFHRDEMNVFEDAKLSPEHQEERGLFLTN